VNYFKLCTDVSDEEIVKTEEALRAGDNPRNAKARLAHTIVELYHSEKDAQKAEEAFDAVFRKGQQPDDMRTVLRSELTNVASTAQVLVDAGLAPSKSEARRLIEQGGVKKDGKKVGEDFGEAPAGTVVRVGKRKFVKIEVK